MIIFKILQKGATPAIMKTCTGFRFYCKILTTLNMKMARLPCLKRRFSCIA